MLLGMFCSPERAVCYSSVFLAPPSPTPKHTPTFSCFFFLGEAQVAAVRAGSLLALMGVLHSMLVACPILGACHGILGGTENAFQPLPQLRSFSVFWSLRRKSALVWISGASRAIPGTLSDQVDLARLPRAPAERLVGWSARMAGKAGLRHRVWPHRSHMVVLCTHVMTVCCVFLPWT